MADDIVTVVGAGLAGAMLACQLGQAGRRVDLHERRDDPRTQNAERGRSINLALSTRGLHALEQVGLADAAVSLGVLMRGRMIHPASGPLAFQPYGTSDREALHSVPRAGLNHLLVEKATTYPTVRIFFGHRCTGVDLERGVAEYSTPLGKESFPYSLLVGADGAHSAVRSAFQRRERFDYSQEYLGHGYKELSMPAEPGGAFRMEKHALHIWPRGGFMMIALPNSDGSFTCTLFCPYERFDALRTPADVRGFFLKTFPDAVPMLPCLEEEFFSNPTGPLVTIRSRPWSAGGKAVLLGDAAHAVVPFLGQGMNAAFEDCTVLVECLQRHPTPQALVEYERRRKPHTDVLARLCIANYHEMRDRVGSSWFVWRKRLEMALHRLMPGWHVPLYTMVEFSRIPYADAERRAAVQGRVLACVLLVLVLLFAWLLWRLG